MLMVEPSGRTSKTGYCLSYLFLVHRTTEVLFDVWWTPVVCNPDATTACLCSEFCRHLGEMNSEIRQWWDACLCDIDHIQHGKHSNSSHQWQGGISSDTTACLCTKYCTSTELKRQFILLIFCRNYCWTTHAVQSNSEFLYCTYVQLYMLLILYMQPYFCTTYSPTLSTTPLYTTKYNLFL